MLDLTFTDYLFLVMELIAFSISHASDLALWFANRFRTDSNTCRDGEQKKNVTVDCTPNRVPLLWPPKTPRSLVLQLVVPLSQDLALNQGAIHIHIRVRKEDASKQDRRRVCATQQSYLIVSINQTSRPQTTNDDLTLTRYLPIRNTCFKA